VAAGSARLIIVVIEIVMSRKLAPSCCSGYCGGCSGFSGRSSPLAAQLYCGSHFLFLVFIWPLPHWARPLY